MRSISNADFTGKRVFVRTDFNVTWEHGLILDDTRIIRSIPTLKLLLEQGAKVIIASHRGRPVGQIKPELSLAPLAQAIAEHIEAPVTFSPDITGHHALDKVQSLKPGTCLLLENLRFDPGEETNDHAFSAALAELADLYVNEAFSCSHRAHASIVGVPQHRPGFAGLGLITEITNLERLTDHPPRPLMAIIGGSKISSKLALIKNVLRLADHLVIVGAMSNTILQARGLEVGRSKVEEGFDHTIAELDDLAARHQCAIHLPCDGVTATSPDEQPTICAIDAVDKKTMVLDIGPQSVVRFQALIDQCQTVLWNGPAGMFEKPAFAKSSLALAQHIASKPDMTSIAGGGDTAAVLRLAGVLDAFTWVSTGGGAFLAWLEGRPLDGIVALEQS